MRILLLLCSLGAAGFAAYLATAAKNSYSAYSVSQLDMMEAELARVSQGREPDSEEALVSLQLLREERQRRQHFPLAAGAAGLLGLAGVVLLVRGGGISSRFSVSVSSGEETRLVAAMGRPEDLAKGAREKAAALLGVRPDAPPSVILAACEAQLQEYDAARMAGLPPDMQRQAREQREALVRAKDLLLKPPGA
ncbi:hypothetical protein [Pyxidicoccus trucidator]|uniref:hypothetical protein n=1 Tax=Pyxidicoccus trucidator TaxID=2709662 RepID=UPI0013D95EA1|nr:hypothetical protein [Pyxidicoccus trucidator]